MSETQYREILLNFKDCLELILNFDEVLSEENIKDFFLAYTILLAYSSLRFPILKQWIQNSVYKFSKYFNNFSLYDFQNIEEFVIIVKCLRILNLQKFFYNGDLLVLNIGTVLNLATKSSNLVFNFQLFQLLNEAFHTSDSFKLLKAQEINFSNECFIIDLEIESLIRSERLSLDDKDQKSAYIQSIHRVVIEMLHLLAPIKRLSIDSTNKIAKFGDIWLPILDTNQPSRLIKTPTTVQNINLIAEAILSEMSILVQGEPGIGKSCLIRELATVTGHEKDLVVLHINDQTDCKALIGSYVCTDIPGEFIWQSGIITQAVIRGFWVIVEDIDKVPVDFIAMISSLLESRTLYLPHRKYPILAHNNFRLFGTRNISGHMKKSNFSVRDNSYMANMRHFAYTWNFVTLDSIDSAEAQMIVSTLYPSLPLEIITKLMYLTQDNDQAGNKSQMFSKKLNLRELLRIARRIDHHCSSYMNSTGYLTDASKMKAFQDILDIVCGGIRNESLWREMITALGARWGLPLSEIEHSILYTNPNLEVLDTNENNQDQELIRIGRAQFIHPKSLTMLPSNQNFAQTNYAKRLLEKVAVCVEMNEPILLVGETGSGKTTTIQELARLAGKVLNVQNLSLSSDVSDLLGGYRPMTIRQMLLNIYEQFVRLFQDTLSSSKNAEYLLTVSKLFQESKWKNLLKAFEKACQMALSKINSSLKTKATEKLLQRLKDWEDFLKTVEKYKSNLPKMENGFAFAFQKGLLLEAMQNGHWILMDEINLASAETLQGLSGFLDPENSTILADNGDAELRSIKRHPEFRVFGAMNPPTDVCKKELPLSLRTRFTELYVPEMTDSQDLMLVVEKYFNGISDAPFKDIVDVYLACRTASEEHLIDGTGHKPRYSLRSLTRSLRATLSYINMGLRPLNRCLFESFLLNFQTMLSEKSKAFMFEFLRRSLFEESKNKDLNFPPPRPGGKSSKNEDWVLVKPFWVRAGPFPTIDWMEKKNDGKTKFVPTKTVINNIRTLTAAVAANVAPILLQGPTSIGKTTMVQYLAAKTGHKCVRINNHEHTDVQEYIGGYVTGSDGLLKFQDGLLVQALRSGYWIILDELNLAPSDVLEALNRLLDDNRELLIPETGEIVRPSPGFQLFATQNPPGIYGGRKPLSLAFRNRFIEIDLTDLPSDEVEQIITESCGIAPKYSKMLVKIMVELQIHRSKSSVFLGKHGAVTIRDLIKWGLRSPQSPLQVAQQGFMLLAEKLRSFDEQQIFLKILSTECKVNLDINSFYDVDKELVEAHDNLKNGDIHIDGVSSIAITPSISRMWKLLAQGLVHSEPVLLIGETGCGKTTICQLYTAYKNQKIRILNCHQSTETSDLIGGLRPVRNRELIQKEMVDTINELVSIIIDNSAQKLELFPNIKFPLTVDSIEESIVACLSILDSLSQGLIDTVNTELLDINLFKSKLSHGHSLWVRSKSLFEWEDGPLVKAMKEGDIFLMDEINLADDAVIERINSVLEFSREITLAEKGGLDAEKLKAHPDFRIVATMNPSGDFGKKELSPALRSRFTEIWIPAVSNLQEMVKIVSEILRFDHFSKQKELNKHIAETMLDFMNWMNDLVSKTSTSKLLITIREVIAWAKFINQISPSDLQQVYSSFVHGAFLTTLDGLGIGQSIPRDLVKELKTEAFTKLLEYCPLETRIFVQESASFLIWHESAKKFVPQIQNGKFNLGIFSTNLGPFYSPEQTKIPYALDAASTILNMGRVLRALQINRPILLEGPPGVGKSSLITNLAHVTGHKFVRINLSEHTELSDLLGSDLPVSSETSDEGAESSNAPKFKWYDGIFLTAMKEGSWVLLDELNLAPQTVLEGLNACFDHRGQVFLPEIGQTVYCAPSFRVFCAQNPMVEGGGRKGLPSSFLSRFTRVFVEAMNEDDMIDIVKKVIQNHYLDLHNDQIDIAQLILQMVQFIGKLENDITVKSFYGREGGPWEFNLRDIFRWCEMIGLLLNSTTLTLNTVLSQSAYILFVLRMRTISDREEVCKTFRDCFGFPISVNTQPTLQVTSNNLLISGIKLQYHHNLSLHLLSTHGISTIPSQTNNEKNIESLAYCVALKWPALLVGLYGSGKRSSIEHLAKHSGNKIRYFSAIPSLDSTELLGSFEQSNIIKKVLTLYEKIEGFILEIFSKDFTETNLFHQSSLMNAYSQIFDIFTPISQLANDFQSGHINDVTSALNLFQSLQDIISLIWNLVSTSAFTLLEDSEKRLVSLRDQIQIAQKEFNQHGSFTWENGVIVEAMIEGSWLIFDNVNLASASVLDRLNSVLEPNGSLILTEDGSGKPIIPHPNFRIFFVMNPIFGDVSRAMRNRCLEIYYHNLENKNISYDIHDRLNFPKQASILNQGYYLLIKTILKMDSLSSKMYHDFELKSHFFNIMLRVLDNNVIYNKSLINIFSSPVFKYLIRKEEVDELISSSTLDEFKVSTTSTIVDISRRSSLISSEDFSLIFFFDLFTHATLEYNQMIFKWFELYLMNAVSRIENSPGSTLFLYTETISQVKDFLSHLDLSTIEIRSELIRGYILACLVLRAKDNTKLASLLSFITTTETSQLFDILSHFSNGSLTINLELSQFLFLYRAKIILKEQILKTKSAQLSSQWGPLINSFSLYEIAYAVFYRVIIPDSRELVSLGTLYKIYQSIDDILGQIHFNAWNKSNHLALIECMKQIVEMRDTLFELLSNKSVNPVQIQTIVWDEILIVIRWIEKACKQLFSFSATASNLFNQDYSSVYILFTNNIQQFYQTLHNLWGNSSTYIEKNIKLWKKSSGIKSIPNLEKYWEPFLHLKNMINTIRPIEIKSTQLHYQVFSEFTFIMKEWLYVYSMFYIFYTNEKKALFESNHLLQDLQFNEVSFQQMISGLSQKISDLEQKNQIQNLEEILSQVESMEFHEQESILYTHKEIRRRIQLELKNRITNSALIFSQSIVYINFIKISHFLSYFLIQRQSVLQNIINYSSKLQELKLLLKTTIQLVTSLTTFNPIILRELQTLVWSLETLEKNSKNNKLKDYLMNFLILSKEFAGLLDEHLMTFHMMIQPLSSVNFSFTSSTQNLLYSKTSSLKNIWKNIIDSENQPLIQSNSFQLLNLNSLAYVSHLIDLKSLFPNCSIFSEKTCDIQIISQFEALSSLQIAYQSGVKRISSAAQVGIYDENFFLQMHKFFLYLMEIIQVCKGIFSDDLVQICQESFTNEKYFDVTLILLNALENNNCHDFVCLKNIFEQSFIPMLRLVDQLRTLSDLNSCNFILGQAWIYLGLLRFHLLIPSFPVDPAIKPKIKSQVLSSLIQNKTLIVSADILLNLNANISILNENNVELIREIHEIKQQVVRYDNSIMIRPANTPSFIDLFAELIRLADGSIGFSHVVQIMDKIISIASCSNKSSSHILHMIEQQSSTFQMTLFDIQKQLKNKYFYYQDILSPLFSSFENISHGFYLLTISSEKKVRTPKSSIVELFLSYLLDINNNLSTSTENTFQAKLKWLIDNSNTFIQYTLQSISNESKQTESLKFTTKQLEEYGQYLSSIIYYFILNKIDYLLGMNVDKYEHYHSIVSNLLVDYASRYNQMITAREESLQAENSLYQRKQANKEEDKNYDYVEDEVDQMMKLHFPNHLEDLAMFLNNPSEQSEEMNQQEEDEHNDLGQELNSSDNSSVTLDSKHGKFEESLIFSIIGTHFRNIFLSSNNQISWLNSIKKQPLTQKQYYDSIYRKNKIFFLKTFDVLFSDIITPSMKKEADYLSLTVLSEMISLVSLDQVKENNDGVIFSDHILGDIDRDMLYILHLTNSTTLNVEFSPRNFHFDPFPEETVLAKPVLVSTNDRLCELLQQFPSNDILLRLLKLVQQIMKYHVTIPLGKMLTNIQVLLKCSEEWENYAAKHVSLSENIKQMSQLIVRWRTLELKSWDSLLRTQEIIYVQSALKNWVNLVKVFKQEVFSMDEGISVATQSLEKFITCLKEIPGWLSADFKQNYNEILSNNSDKSTAFHLSALIFESKDLKENSLSYLTKLMNTLDSFLRTSNIGEFPVRLHLIRLMGLMLEKEVEITSTNNSFISQVSKLTLGIWQYYDQYLPTIRKYQELLKGPIEKRVKDEVKLGKWDSLNIYALLENADKIHRKLTKFLKEYACEVLELPVHTILQRELMKGFVDESGEIAQAIAIPTNYQLFPNVQTQDNTDEPFSDIVLKLATRYDFTKSLPKFQFNCAKMEKKFTELFPRFNKLKNLSEKMKSYLQSLFDFTLFLQEDEEEDDDNNNSVDENKDGNIMVIEETKGTYTDSLDSINSNYALKVASIASSYVEEIFSRIDSLRNEDATKPLKLKAIRDLFDTLKESGFSYLRSDIPLQIRSNIEVLSSSISLSSQFAKDIMFVNNNSRDLIEKGEYYFNRNLAEIAQLRVQITSVFSKDISHRDANNMVNVSENIMVHNMRLRSTLECGLIYQQELNKSFNKYCQLIENLSESSSNQTQINLENMLHDCDNILNSLLNEFLRLLQLCSTQNSVHLALPQLEKSFGVDLYSLQVLDDENIRQLQTHMNQIVNLLTMLLFTDPEEILASKDLRVKQQQINEKSLQEEEFSIENIFKLCFIANDETSKKVQSNITNKPYLRIQCLTKVLPKVLSSLNEIKESLIVVVSSDRISSYLLSLESMLAQGNTLLGSFNVSIKSDQIMDISGSSQIFTLLHQSIENSMLIIQRLKSLQQLVYVNDLTEEMIGMFNESIFIGTGKNISDITLTQYLSLSMKIFDAFQMPKLIQSIHQINHLIESTFLPSNVLFFDMKCVFALMMESYHVLIDQFVVAYKSMTKLQYIILRVFRTLLAKGICSAEEKEGEGEGSGNRQNMKFEDDQEGTGMGEGEGKKDVSDQIENEEQLLGTKLDKLNEEEQKEEPKDQKQLNKDEKDEGVDMADDFEGELHDLPEEEKENQDENDDENDEEKDDPDREMGDTDMNDIIDEKQWDSDEEDENGEEKDQEKEKFEKDSKMKGETTEEMHTKSDDEEDDDGENGEEENPETKSKEKNEQNENGDKNDSDEENINEDDDDDYMEKPQGVDVREEENDEGEDNQNDNDQEQDESGEQDDMNLPDNMDLDDQDSNMDVDEEGEPEENNENNDASDLENENPEENKEESPEDEDLQNDENENNQKMNSRGNQPDENEEEDNKEEEDDKPDIDKDKKDEGSQLPPTHGIQDTKGKDSILESQEADADNKPNGEEEQTPDKQQQNMESDPSTQQGTNESQSSGDKGEWNPSSKNASDSKNDRSKENKSKEPPNPFLNKGNIEKQWFRRLQMMMQENEKQINEINQNDAEDETDRGKNEDATEEVDDDKGKGQFEFADDDDSDNEQVLGNQMNEEENIHVPEKNEIEQKESTNQTSMQTEDPEDQIDKEEKKRNREQENDQDQANQQKNKRKKTEKQNNSTIDPALDDNQEEEFKNNLSDSEEEEELIQDHMSIVGTEDEEEEIIEMTEKSIHKPIYTDSLFQFTRKDGQAQEEEELDYQDPNELIVSTLNNLSPQEYSKSKEKWLGYKKSTEFHAIKLSETLKLILESTLLTRLQGDYRTGKKINMKRIIPYIASGYRKDKIWLRRTKPGKRNYQIMLLIDNSRSMGVANTLALMSMALITNALNKLDINENISIAQFDENAHILHPFHTPFQDDSGVNILNNFHFNAESTNLSQSLSTILTYFKQMKDTFVVNPSESNSSVMQLCFIISDARIDSDNRNHLTNIIQQFSESNILLIFIIIDINKNPRDSIFNTKSITFNEKNEIITKSYFDSFPFPYYLAIQEISTLPDVLCDALKQWFELIKLQSSN